jgi:hypothetical protein
MPRRLHRAGTDQFGQGDPATAGGFGESIAFVRGAAATRLRRCADAIARPTHGETRAGCAASRSWVASDRTTQAACNGSASLVCDLNGTESPPAGRAALRGHAAPPGTESPDMIA